ncbi:hypothetical protein LLG07_00070 [bacterium]|nr:hypothetical protein [bacterium]
MNKEELKNIIIKEIIKDIGVGNIQATRIADSIISKIPEQIITEDKILEVLEEHSGKDKFGKYFKIYEGVWQRFAQEILQDKGWKAVAKGKVTQANEYYEDGALVNDESVTDLLSSFDGKNIEIAVREVK